MHSRPLMAAKGCVLLANSDAPFPIACIFLAGATETIQTESNLFRFLEEHDCVYHGLAAFVALENDFGVEGICRLELPLSGQVLNHFGR